MKQALPFSDFVIVELASVLAGPSVGMFFAELGATVIKAENPLSQGDMTRSWKLESENSNADVSAYFSAINWGKYSIAIDYSTQEGHKLVLSLIEKADMVLSSFKPGDGKKFGLDADALLEIFPSLVIGEISGYGPDDPRVAFDAVLQAESGLMYLNGSKESGPIKIPVPIIDVLAAHQLKEGLLIALLEKTKTGKGKKVQVSLYDTAIASLANYATNWLVANHLPERTGSAHPNIAPYGDTFFCQDKKELLLAVGSDKHFRKFCDVLKISTLALDPAFSTNRARVKNRKSLHAVLAAEISKYPSATLIQLLQENKIPAALISDLKHVFERPESQALLLNNGILGVRTAIFAPHPGKMKAPPAFDADREWVLAFTKTKEALPNE